MTTADTLRAARALIERPERWTQGAMARRADGLRCRHEDDAACRWCTSGAVRRVAQSGEEAAAALRRLYEVMKTTPPDFNDSHTHAEILAAFDRAIEIAERSK